MKVMRRLCEIKKLCIHFRNYVYISIERFLFECDTNSIQPLYSDLMTVFTERI